MGMDSLRRVSSEPQIKVPDAPQPIKRTQSQVTIGANREPVQPKVLGEGDTLAQTKGTGQQKETSMAVVTDVKHEAQTQTQVDTHASTIPKLPQEVVEQEVVNQSKPPVPDNIIGDQAGEAEKAHTGKEKEVTQKTEEEDPAAKLKKEATQKEVAKIMTITNQQDLKEALRKFDKLLEQPDTKIDKAMVTEAKTALINKYLPKLDLTTASEQDVKSFVTNFKEITKGDSRFSKTHAVEKLLDELVKISDGYSPISELGEEDKKDYAAAQEFALGRLEAELNKFIAKTPESTKMEWMKLLQDKVGSMKDSVTQEPEVKKQAEAFNKSAVEVLGKIQLNSPKDFRKLESIGKDNPMGEFGWAVLTGNKEDVVKQLQHALCESGLNSSVATLETAEKVYESVRKGYIVQADPMPKGKIFKDIEKPLMDKITLNGKEYSFDHRLGAGSFGAAFKFTHTDESGVETSVVLKMFNNVYDGNITESGLQDAVKEMNAHRHITLSPENQGKQNTLKELGAMQDSNGYMYSVMELADGGQISDIMDGMNTLGKSGVLSPGDEILMKQYLAKGSIDGMVYIHETADSAHLDIKPDNVFYDKTTGQVKVADYGTVLTRDGDIKGVGTPDYMSPETMESSLIPQNAPSMKEVAKSSDKFSLGQTLSQLVTGKVLATSEGSSWEMSQARVKFGREGGKGSTVDGKLINPVAADEYKKLRGEIQTLETKLKGTLPPQERKDEEQQLKTLKNKAETKRKEAYEQIEMPTKFGEVLSQTVTGKVEDRSKALSEVRKNPFFSDLDTGKYSDNGIKARRLIGETIEFSSLQKKLDKLTEEKNKLTSSTETIDDALVPRLQKELTSLEDKKAGLEKQLKQVDSLKEKVQTGLKAQGKITDIGETEKRSIEIKEKLTKEIAGLTGEIQAKSQSIEENKLKSKTMHEDLAKLEPQIKESQTKVDARKVELKTLGTRIDSELNEVYKLQQELGKFGEAEKAKGKTLEQIIEMPEYKSIEKAIDAKIDQFNDFNKPIGATNSAPSTSSSVSAQPIQDVKTQPKGLMEEIRQKGQLREEIKQMTEILSGLEEGTKTYRELNEQLTAKKLQLKGKI